MRVTRQLYYPLVLILIILFISSESSDISGQSSSYNYFYRVYLKDKGGNNTSNISLSDLVSTKASERRKKSGITQADFRDLPVWPDYLNQIVSEGLTLHCKSKWMNTALFKSQHLIDISPIQGLPFVSEVRIVKRPGIKSSFIDKLDFEVSADDISAYDRPITMVNGYPLHNSGFNGTNVLIAVLDGGFINADLISSLIHLKNRDGIRFTYDFVTNSSNVYNSSNHGTAVLSILAGKAEGYLAGTATGADYLLLKTEDVASEFPCEEDFWVAGAEYADSAGADIISSSLGYFIFDDPALNYKITDLDGNTAYVTKAADIAASKGILVVNSAGNERTNGWKKIIFPSDGDSVLTSAAVDGNKLIATFSSAGPSADGRVKPDVATMGVSVPLQITLGSVARASGTSFSCPVLSGMAACLIQAVPEAGNYDIMEAIRASSDRKNSPDSLYGYGIPDMLAALNILQDRFVRKPESMLLSAPNPTTGVFEIILREDTKKLTIEIFTMTGKIIFNKDYPEYAGRRIRISELQNHDQGIYLIRLNTDSGTSAIKVIKLNY